MLKRSEITYHDITPELAIDLLKDGNKRFVENKQAEQDLQNQVRITSKKPHAYALVLNCFDSRLPTELIFDLGIGDIFNIRIGGNIINDDIIGSMEFACKNGGIKVILVLGHTLCEAVKGACDQIDLGSLSAITKKIEPAIHSVLTPEGADRSSKNEEFVNRVAKKNVEISMANIKQQSPIIRKMLESGEIGLIGAMYDIRDGQVKFGI